MKRLILFITVVLAYTTATSAASQKPAINSTKDVVRYGTNFYPPEGKVLHIAGQAKEDFDDYVENVSCNGEKFGMPAGAAFYTSLSLNGITSSHANVPGDNHQHLNYLVENYDNMTLQVALWLHTTQLSRICTGEYDVQIEKLADIFKNYKRPIYFRIGYEFDNTGCKFEPVSYQNAYRYIVERFEQANVRNVSYVWHSWGMIPTYQNRDIMDWYPGDAYVNWIGISTFEVSKEQISEEGYYQNHNRERILEIAREKNLPIMICESSAIRTIPYHKKRTGQAYWDFWYKPYFEFIENNPEVKAFSIINCDWDSVLQFKGEINWGDSRIKSDPVVLNLWRAKMREKRYLHSSDKLYDLLRNTGSMQ